MAAAVPEYVPIKEAARRLRVKPKEIRRRIKDEELEGYVLLPGEDGAFGASAPNRRASPPPEADAHVKRLEETVLVLQSELNARRQEVEELHVLLREIKESVAAAPSPAPAPPIPAAPSPEPAAQQESVTSSPAGATPATNGPPDSVIDWNAYDAESEQLRATMSRLESLLEQLESVEPEEEPEEEPDKEPEQEKEPKPAGAAPVAAAQPAAATPEPAGPAPPPAGPTPASVASQPAPAPPPEPATPMPPPQPVAPAPAAARSAPAPAPAPPAAPPAPAASAASATAAGSRTPRTPLERAVEAAKQQAAAAAAPTPVEKPAAKAPAPDPSEPPTGEALSRRRERMGVSREALAAFSKLSWGFITEVEAGRRKDSSSRKRLAATLDAWQKRLNDERKKAS